MSERKAQFTSMISQMTGDQDQIVDHSPDSSALDRAVTDGHIIAFHRCCSDDTQNIVSDHREFQNQRICLELSAGQALAAHIRFDLTVIRSQTA